jgi:hypothetical protein
VAWPPKVHGAATAAVCQEGSAGPVAKQRRHPPALGQSGSWQPPCGVFVATAAGPALWCVGGSPANQCTADWRWSYCASQSQLRWLAPSPLARILPVAAMPLTCVRLSAARLRRDVCSRSPHGVIAAQQGWQLAPASQPANRMLLSYHPARDLQHQCQLAAARTMQAATAGGCKRQQRVESAARAQAGMRAQTMQGGPMGIGSSGSLQQLPCGPCSSHPDQA